MREKPPENEMLVKGVAIVFDAASHGALKRLVKITGMSFGALVRRSVYHWLASDDCKAIEAAGLATAKVMDEFRFALDERNEKGKNKA